MRFNPLQSKLISCAFAFSLGAPNNMPSIVFTFRFAFVEPILLQKLKMAHLSGHKGPQVGLQALHYTGFSRLYDAAALREVQKLLKKYKTADIFYTVYFPFSGLAMKQEVMLFCNYFIIKPSIVRPYYTFCYNLGNSGQILNDIVINSYTSSDDILNNKK